MTAAELEPGDVFHFAGHRTRYIARAQRRHPNGGQWIDAYELDRYNRHGNSRSFRLEHDVVLVARAEVTA